MGKKRYQKGVFDLSTVAMRPVDPSPRGEAWLMFLGHGLDEL